MEEENQSQANSSNKFIAGGGGAILGSIAAWASVNGINDYFKDNRKNLASKVGEIKESLNFNQKDLDDAKTALREAKRKLTQPEVIAVVAVVFVGVTVLSGLAINALLPDNKIDPATVEKQQIETIEKSSLANDKIEGLKI